MIDMKKLLLSCLALIAATAIYAQELQSEANPQENPTVVVVRTSSPAETRGGYVPQNLPAVYDWRTRRQSVTISVGLPSIYATGFGGHSWSFYIPASGPGSTPSSEIFTGAWSIEYNYNVLWWLRLGASANYECWTGLAQTHDMSLTARVDFTYINREHITVYSGLSTGVYSHIERATDGSVRGRFLPAVNMTPIGLNFGGQHVFGLVETNIGSASVLRVGIGFRP